MRSERIQRQIDALLDQAEGAVSDGAWNVVVEKARAVLAFHPDNADALALIAAAAAMDAQHPATEATARQSEASPAATGTAAVPNQPDAFAAGRYAVRRFLGEGGKKKVYLAHDSLLDRDIAFALIKAEGLDATARERITREAQAMGRLGSHPHIVSIFDIGEHEGTPYVVTELMGGGDVEGLIEQASGALPLERTLEIATGVARGLSFAHERQVVHRDLKPGNVWLTVDGIAKIGDFGLAVSLDRTRLTQHGMMVGTVAYMPPEQALGGATTPQADLYSLGAMLYEMVTGRPPFAGSDSTAVISQHINAPPVAPSWHSDHCPPLLEELILRLLAKVPDDRPASAAEVLAVLERVDPAERSASHSTSAANPLDRLARGAFVGRTGELERLRTAFDDAFAGRGSVVMLVGEPGIGKTRTAQELETHARMRGAHVFWGRTHESAGMPAYWPWVQVGNAWGGAVDLIATGGQPLIQGGGLVSETAELVRLFPALRQLPGFVEPPASGDPESAQFRLFDAYAQFMRNQSRERPWLVILDDLHWADKATLQLLQFVARELANMRVLVVGTYRDTDLVRTHPLSEALAELNREGGFLRLSLRGLEREEVADYIAQRAGVRPPREVVDRIFEETEGNPFFLSEVVNLMAEEGTLRSSSVSEIALPEGVREALGRRLDRLSEETNELLHVCAISGRQFNYDTLTLLSERSDEELLRRIEEALRARVIEETETPGRYRFTHALMHETLLGELSTTRRVRLHGQVGEALERRWGDHADDQAARLAMHFGESATLTAGHAAKAARYARIAGEQAEAQLGWDEAARHYEDALALMPRTAPDVAREEADLGLALGRAYVATADFRSAWRTLLQAIDGYRALGDIRGAALAAVVTLNVPAPKPRSRDVIARVLSDELQRAEPALAARLLAERAATFNPRLEPSVAADQHEVERLAEAVEDEGVRGALATLQARAALSEGDLQAAIEAWRRAWRHFDAVGEFGRAGESLWSTSMISIQGGNLEASVADAQAAVDYSRRVHARYSEQNGLQHIARLALQRGEFDRAREQVTVMAARPGTTYLKDEVELQLVESAGDPWPPGEIPSMSLGGGVETFRLHLHGIRGRMLLESGDAVGCEQELQAHWDAFLDLRAGVPTPWALLHAAFGWTAIERAGSTELVRNWYEAYGEHPEMLHIMVGSALRFRGALALRLNLVDEAYALLSDALRICERERAVLDLGRSCLGLAEVAQMRGQVEEAREHLDRAGEVFAQCGAKRFLDEVLAKKEILKA